MLSRGSVRRRRRGVAGVGVAAMIALAGSSAPASAAVPQGFVGVNPGGPVWPNPSPGVDVATQLDTMVWAGVEELRVVFDWGYAQPYRSFSDVSPDQASQFVNVGGIPTRFSQSDQIVALAAQRGIRILPTVLYTPYWAAAP